MKYTAKSPETNHNVSPESPLRELAVFLGGLLALILAIYFLLGWLVDFLAFIHSLFFSD